MKRLAIPISDGKLSEYFGNCDYYEIFDIENGQLLRKSTLIPKENKFNSLPEWAAESGITDIISYKISNNIIMQFALFKINLYVGIPVNTSEILIAEFLKGNMKSDTKIIAEIIADTHE